MLVPGGMGEFAVPTLVEDTLNVPLEHPILRLKPQDVASAADAMRWADILESWILIDRENVINSRAGMYWVMGPTRWTTNHQLGAEGVQQFLSGFYHNPANLDRFVANVLRSGMALRLIMDQFRLHGVEMGRSREEAALDALLDVFEPHFDDVARKVWTDEGQSVSTEFATGPKVDRAARPIDPGARRRLGESLQINSLL